jgi:hypothetical protein
MRVAKSNLRAITLTILPDSVEVQCGSQSADSWRGDRNTWSTDEIICIKGRVTAINGEPTSDCPSCTFSTESWREHPLREPILSALIPVEERIESIERKAAKKTLAERRREVETTATTTAEEYEG